VVKKSLLDRFVKLGGYETVRRKENKKWRGISEASKRTELSRPTIYAILKKYPEQPSKTKPKYVEEFEESEGYKLLKQRYEKRVSKTTFSKRLRHIMTAWKLLNKKDPVSWTEEDYLKIWNMPQFVRKDIGFYEEYASSFHVMMRLTNNYDLLSKEEFRGHKLPSGKKKEWFLREPEIKEAAICHTEPDCLLFEFAGIVWGARASAMLNVRVKDISFHDYTIQVFEKKMKKKANPYVSKYPPLGLFRLLRRYIEDFNLNPEDRLFPRSYTFYNDSLRTVGEQANLEKKLSTHILKHTFVSQGHRHGLSRETIIEMTGTEDQTIKKFYLYVDENKIRHETQGRELETKPFWRWIEEDIAPIFEKRYMEIMHPEQIHQPQEIQPILVVH